MSQPPSKRSRSRSSDSIDQDVSQSGDGTESTISRNKKYSAYRDINYDVVLETKGCFMRPSPQGMVDEDEELWNKILTATQPIPSDLLFDGDHFQSFHSNLRGRSELRICVDLHPRVVPSVENLSIAGRKEFNCFVEGYNDVWAKCVPFYGPRPQPDHTIGFKWSSFTEQQRQKLGIEPMAKSYYTAREDIYFPFFTSEVKCGKQSLDLADRPNTHSMTVAMQGIMEVSRRAGRVTDIHRRLAGISISHDDNGARIYAHYPEIENDRVTYWRTHPKEISFRNDNGRERWKCYQVTLNVCQMFGLPLLQRLRAIIDELPDPETSALDLAGTSDISMQSSQEGTGGPDSPDEIFRRPRQPRGLNAELRSMIQNLQQQGEQQRQSMKAKEAILVAQLDQQRKDLEQQRKAAEHQQQDLMKMLKQQSEQISKLLSK